MSLHTPSTTYAQFIADVGAANATHAASVATAASTLATALSTANANYRPNDGGVFAAAVLAAYNAYDASVKTAHAVNDAAVAASLQAHKGAAHIP